MKMKFRAVLRVPVIRASLRALGHGDMSFPLLLGALLLAIMPLKPTQAAEVLPELMGSLGDSITAGSFSDTNMLGDPKDRPLPDPRKDKGGVIQNKATLSWASGLRIQSHITRLRNVRSGRPVEILNLSVPGSRAMDVPAQAQQLVDAAKSHQYAKVSYVTIMIGGNDACAKGTEYGTPLPKLRADLKQTFAKLAEIKQRDRIKILVGSIPRVPDLGLPEIRNYEIIEGMTCGMFRDRILKHCVNMTTWTTREQYKLKLAAVEAMNDLLRTLVDEANREHPNLKVSFGPSIWNMPVRSEMLAVDCFHPNQDGQELISELLWADQPFFK